MIRNIENFFINWMILHKYNKWDIKEIREFRTTLEDVNLKDDDIIDSLYSIMDYKLPYQKDFKDHMKEKLYYHQLGINHVFNDIEETLQGNKENKNQMPEKNFQTIFKQFKDKNYLFFEESDYEIIKESYDAIKNYKSELSNLNDDEITNLAKNIKAKKFNIYDAQSILHLNKEKKADNPFDINKIIALINEATNRKFHHYLNDIQIISVLCFLNKKKDKGRIAQILTGEGKTRIIVTLACVLVLLGRKVDIVTSSEVLAKRDANDTVNQQIYSMLGITASHCIDEDKKVKT